METLSELLPDQNLIVQVHFESCTLAEFIDLRKEQKANGWIKKGVNSLLVDLSGAPKVSLADLKTYGQWAEENLKELARSKTAIIVNTPQAAALTIMATSDLKGQRYIKQFSTLNAAVRWLNVPKEAILEHFPQLEAVDLD
ncbi:hypothetical protein [Pelagicoccus albus]|uniref:SpoIIAA-like n=1 Tax=Pelagicoccus albus TaxID=415222 RepID=A0A7X1B6R4_9BACT|nr:hypothetical protein [Pelagicoccus albus]MBC2606672.1 hypothetical protein [Pelagicoccus albus]